MIGLDTNVLLRYLAQDDPAHSRRATEIVERRLTVQEPGFVSLVSILEVVWVLKSLSSVPGSRLRTISKCC